MIYKVGINKLPLGLKAQSQGENQAADLKKGKSSPHPLPFVLGALGLQRALHSRPRREEQSWGGGKGGYRSTRSGGWDNTGKSEKLDLHKISHSCLVGFLL